MGMAAFSATNSPYIFTQPTRHRTNFHLHYYTPTPSNLVKSHFNPQYFAPPNNRHSMSRRTAPIFTAPAQFSVADEDSTSTSTTNSSVQGWEEFAEKVSGEWDGFGADFTVEGNPLELPEQVVPEAYREWEVKVFDWQTQCPTLAQLLNNSSPSLIYKTIKLLPTVGCEADAATRYSIHERNVDDSSAFAYQNSTGSYVALWPGNANASESSSMELEHCLIDPRDKESRVRIIQVLRLQDSKLTLKGIKVFVEQWYGPFRNGDQLGGCAIRDSAFASTQPLNASQVAGVWQGVSSVTTFHTSQNIVQQLGDERVCESTRDADDLVLLPKQLWCSVRKAVNEEETNCEVGWLLDQGRAVTSKCIITSTGELKEIAISNETASVALGMQLLTSEEF